MASHSRWPHPADCHSAIPAAHLAATQTGREHDSVGHGKDTVVCKTGRRTPARRLTASKSYGSRQSQLMQQGRLSSKTSLLIQATGCRIACRAPFGLLPTPDSCTQHRFTIQRTFQQYRAMQAPVSAALTCPEDGTKSCRSARAAGWGTASTWTSPLPSTRARRPSLHMTEAHGASNWRLLSRQRQARGPTEPGNQAPFCLEADVKSSATRMKHFRQDLKGRQSACYPAQERLPP